MHKRELLLRRLDEIASSLQRTDGALALLGLGSVGLETERLDEYSDLDFFVVVRDGCKAAFIESLGWLERVRPIAFAYRNTPDGHKALFDDGVFCEFAVFEARRSCPGSRSRPDGWCGGGKGSMSPCSPRAGPAPWPHTRSSGFSGRR